MRVGDGLDAGEPLGARLRDGLGGQRPLVRRLRRDERRARPRRAARGCRRRPCRPGSTRRRCSRGAPAAARAASPPPRAYARRRAPPTPFTSRRPARRTSTSWSIGAAEIRLRRLAGSAEPHLVVGEQRCELAVREHDDRSRSGHRELLPRDLLPRAAEDVGVLETHVRQQHDAARRGRSSRRAGRRGPPRRRRRRRRARRNRRTRRPSGARTASRRAPPRRRARARSRPRSRRRRCRAAPTSRPRAATCRRRCGALRRRAAQRSWRVAVDLPFVPTTWIASKARSGMAEPLEQRLHPLEPESVRGQGESEATQAVSGRSDAAPGHVGPGSGVRQQGVESASFRPQDDWGGLSTAVDHRRTSRSGVAEGGELAAVALELLALRSTTSAGAFWTKRSLASIFSARAISCRSRARSASASAAARCGARVGLHDGLEDPRLVALERRHDAGAAEHLRRLLHAAERAGLRLVTGLGPRRDDQQRAARGEVRPDLLGHVRHHGVQQRRAAARAPLSRWRAHRRRRRTAGS